MHALKQVIRSFTALVLGLALFGAGATQADDRVRVVASTTDLASIASSVGGDLVDVSAICRPNADPHHVEVLPSYMVRVSKAQLYLKVGLGLDQWADLIVEGSHGRDVRVVDCSTGVPVLERPAGKVDASMGDVHPDGNPHYWLDPSNGAIVARTIADALGRVDPTHAADFAARAGQFGEAAAATAAKGQSIVAALPSKGVVTYHRSWTYFAQFLGLDVVTTIEPVPGIPPTGKHLDEVIGIIKSTHPLLVLEEPYFSEDAGKFLARATGITVARVGAACEDVTAESYLAHFDSLFDELRRAAAGATSTQGN